MCIAILYYNGLIDKQTIEKLPLLLKQLVQYLKRKLFDGDTTYITFDDGKTLPITIKVPKAKKKPFQIKLPEWAGEVSGTIFVIYVGANYLKKVIKILRSINDYN